MKRLKSLIAWYCRVRNKERFFVCSEEPFETKLIWRGPFNRKDANSLLAIYGACGSVDRLYEKVGDALVPV